MKGVLENQNSSLKPLKVGDIVEGEVVGVGKSALYLSLGPFGAGVVYGREFYEEKSKLKDLKIGDKIFCKVVGAENEDGYFELSVKQAGEEISWKKLEDMKAKQEIIRVKIEGANKGGLMARVLKIPAFLPVSQLSIEHYPRVEGGDPSKILEELQKMVGMEIMVRVLDVDQKTNKLILSERAAESPELKELLKKYKVGDVVEGEITGVVDFGAFLQFPIFKEKTKKKLEGLIHISELDWQIIDDPSRIVKVGDKVKAKIINISDDRVFLSIKALKKDPWEGLDQKYKKGDKIKGKVLKFNPFGAFVEIAPKIQGLCHISEFGTKERMEEALKIGEQYDFEVLEINPKEHRLLLKLLKPSP